MNLLAILTNKIDFYILLGAGQDPQEFGSQTSNFTTTNPQSQKFEIPPIHLGIL
jgi:hypothetical protein